MKRTILMGGLWITKIYALVIKQYIFLRCPIDMPLCDIIIYSILAICYDCKFHLWLGFSFFIPTSIRKGELNP
jgi:hypothetical protein